MYFFFSEHQYQYTINHQQIVAIHKVAAQATLVFGCPTADKHALVWHWYSNSNALGESGYDPHDNR